jgi:hypothetical protein
MTSAGSVVIGKAFINTFLYDIFDKCTKNDPEAAASYMCRNAEDLIQVMIYGLATIIFMFTVFWMTKHVAGRKKAAVKSFLLGLIFFGLIVASWRFILDLQDNFVELLYVKRGVPETFTEYLFSLFNRLSEVLVGVVLGLMVWLPGRMNKVAIPGRKEPRVKFVKKSQAKD